MTKITFFLLFVLLTGCSIQKRHHTGGYDVQWRKTYASTSDELFESENKSGVPCDTLIGKNGRTTLASVERIDSKKIYIKPCENSSGNISEIDRSELSMIHYATGAVFENKTPEQLQKEREENLEKYRLEQPEREKELERQRIAAENEKLRRQNDSLQKVNSELKNKSLAGNNEPTLTSEEFSEKQTEPLMRKFFIFGFSLAALTILLSLMDPFYGAMSLISLVILFITDVVSPFIVLASLIRKKRDKGKYSGHPVLLELLFAVVSFGALVVWVVKNS